MTDAPPAAIPIEPFVGQAAEIAGRITAIRRRIHEQPEIGLENPLTQAVILEELERIGIAPVATGKGCTSVVADIVGTAADPTTSPRVLLRADMDALPLTETADVEWVSKKPGCMHACGHDAHVAMLLGAAELLNACRDRLAGTVRLCFQPGEEGMGGAKVMIDEGLLEGVDLAFALHVAPSVPSDVVTLREGPMLASADVFTAVFKGAGGHASLPHQARDPIPAIGPFVDGLSHAVARETDPDDRVVLSVTQVNAGTTLNVIPPTAECCGTIRAASAEGREQGHARVRRIAEGVAASRGIEVELTIFPGYPVTVNHAGPARAIAETAASIGHEVVWMPSVIMGAEDFSYVLEKVPGATIFLGCQVDGGGPLHSDLMKVDESVLPRGAALYAAVAVRFLAEPFLAPMNGAL